MEPIPISPDDLKLPQAIPLPRRSDWRIGMIGFGEFARRAHAPDYKAVGWPVVAVAASNPEARRVAREDFGIDRVYSDYHALVADEAVEIIDLVTQPALREEVVQAAVQAGKPVIIEKPFGQTAEECQRMVEAAEQAGVPLAIHQNYRWMKGNFLAHYIVRGGWIGSPFFMSVEKFGQQDVNLAGHPFYSRCDDYLTLHWNTHLADLLRYWSGQDARRVAAYTARMGGQNFRSDNLFISLHDFGPGLTGHILHSELLRSSAGGNQCRIDGDQGSVVFDFSGDRILLESRALGQGVRRLDTSGMEWMESLCGSMGDFLLSIEERHEPAVSGRRNLATIQTVLAEVESTKSGGAWVGVSG